MEPDSTARGPVTAVSRGVPAATATIWAGRLHCNLDSMPAGETEGTCPGSPKKMYIMMACVASPLIPGLAQGDDPRMERAQRHIAGYAGLARAGRSPRGPWRMEHALHGVRDMAFRADARGLRRPTRGPSCGASLCTGCHRQKPPAGTWPARVARRRGPPQGIGANGGRSWDREITMQSPCQLGSNAGCLQSGIVIAPGLLALCLWTPCLTGPGWRVLLRYQKVAIVP